MTDFRTNTPPVVLSIAGSDSSSGAGIQADLKSITANGAYACTAITAVTAQNTQGVTHITPLDTSIVAAQIDAIFNDFNVSSVKIGMLATPEITQVVIDKLIQYHAKNIVVDPILLSTKGQVLLSEAAITLCKNKLFPFSVLVTPNLPEFYALSISNDIKIKRDILNLALTTFGCEWLLVKGGHSDDEKYCTDILVHTSGVYSITSPRITSMNTHGTGCTLSSAIATYLAHGQNMLDSVTKAKHYLSDCLLRAQNQRLGSGCGPLDHFILN
ncbi:bifunctional hydroxymethylpyrimidine kinase/phosphomethylpyrimidine kinase [Candidatus Enterovibrio escicola]|uniref:hydroxymethylpyrimidine kinase n=1 Tax=Candidatus Enterovibrio escicola TaxID=1927127 RepID=A0A2A5T0T3_9GAMM|nr:bifunctional hydroxymethylpyrimidine kinase/phosphomethylpyrimidine kinase [Candidatus Enterovibrio escacola]PCS21772.1 Hydroxymethylpyrimidine phosphate kinase ThiD [Candidatus Enterovibrio escacola]